MNIDAKSFYKIVRASSLSEGDAIAYRLKPEEILKPRFEGLREAQKRVFMARYEAFLRNPYKVCEIRKIHVFGSYVLLLLRRSDFRQERGLTNQDSGFIRHSLVVKQDAYIGLFLGQFEGVYEG